MGEDKPLGLLIDYPEGYTTDMFSNREAQFSDEEIDRSGKRAYKAIVMPIVALGASLTFLLLNLIIVASQFIVLIIFWKDHNNKPPSGAQFACSLILACIVFSTPLLLDDGKVVKTEDTTTHKLVQIIYHYEDILTSLTGNDEKSIKKESYVKDKKSAFDKFLDSDPNYNQGDDFDVVREDDYIPVVQEPEEKRTPSFLDSIFNSDSDDAVETVDIN